MSTRSTSRQETSRKVELLSIPLVYDSSVSYYETFQNFKDFLNQKLEPLGYTLKGSEYGKSWERFIVPRDLLSRVSRTLNPNWKILANVSLDERENKLYIQFDKFPGDTSLDKEIEALQTKMAEFCKDWEKLISKRRIPNNCKKINMCLIDHT